MAQSLRASSFWTHYPRMSLAGDLEAEADIDINMGEDGDNLDSRTPLDRTIDRIGMGAYSCHAHMSNLFLRPRI